MTDDFVKSTCHRRWGLTVKKTGPRHWNGPCPVCGGKDRFYITEHGRCTCNQCPFRAWLDDDQKEFKPDPQWLMKKAEIEAKEKAEEAARTKAWQDGFAAGVYWKEWHDCMTDENLLWWYSQGISQSQIDYYELGFQEHKTIELDGEYLDVSAYTIPVRNPEDWRRVVYMHYRIPEPLPEGVQKYRYVHGISPREFYAKPYVDQGTAVVFEGAKKAMVGDGALDSDWQFIGLPSKAPALPVMERIARYYPRVFLALDPGCEHEEQRFKLAVPQSKIVRLPDKPDDLILAGMTRDEFFEYIRQAR